MGNGWRRRRTRTKRLIGELLQGYFDGRMAADQLGRRSREIAGPGFLRSSKFHALTTPPSRAPRT
jgi:hypothetical protein